MVYIIALIVAALGFGAAGITVNQQANQLKEFEKMKSVACYAVEESVAQSVSDSKIVDDCGSNGSYVVSGKTYVRIRQSVKIVSAKIGEGARYAGSCKAGVGALRNITRKSNISGEIGDIYWQDQNYQKNDLQEFIFILTDKKDSDLIFDVYMNRDMLGNIPEFITSCREAGGLVPVLEGQATKTLPPQSLSITLSEFNQSANQVFSKSCCVNDFNSIIQTGYTKDYYLRIQEQKMPGQAVKIGVLIKTVDNNDRIYDVFFHAGSVYLKDATSDSPDKDKTWVYNATNDEPPTQKSWRNFSLQLTNMKFITVSDWSWATPECKPALYLYPESKQPVSVRVVPKGKITRSIPEHGVFGWQVVADPTGAIWHKDTSYPYLYYETRLDTVPIPQNGWLVSDKNLPDFFDTTLTQLGLNTNEIKDFKDYWVPFLSSASNTWQIGLIDNSVLNLLEELVIAPYPDSIIRVRFYFKPIDSSGTMPILYPQVIQQAPQRSGFTVVDWGGVLGGDGLSCQEGFISR